MSWTVSAFAFLIESDHVLSEDFLQHDLQNTSIHSHYFLFADCLGLLQCQVITHDLNPNIDAKIPVAENFQKYSQRFYYPNFYSLDFRQDILRPPQS